MPAAVQIAKPLMEPENGEMTPAGLKAWLEKKVQLEKVRSLSQASDPGQHYRMMVEEPLQLPLGMSEIDVCLNGGVDVGGLHELRAPLARDSAAATAFATAILVMLQALHSTTSQTSLKTDSPRRKIVWITDPALRAENIILYPTGLSALGLHPDDLLLVDAPSLQTALWAADEAARCSDLAAVVLAVRGNPKALDRTATRRLVLRAERSGTLCLILRQSGEEEASAALTRWRVQGAPSAHEPHLKWAIGDMRLAVCLERNRNGRTGHWHIAWNHQRQVFEYVSSATDPDTPYQIGNKPPAHLVGAPAIPLHRSHRARAMGQNLAHHQHAS